jgi:tetratricopeptide (TPR) repeat protein
MAREKQRQVSHGIYRYAAGAGIAALCFLLYVASARYVAAIAFSRGFAASQSTEGIERALSLFKRAVSLDSRNDSYLQGIASAYLAHANTIAEQSGGKPSSEIQKDISTSLTSAVSSAERSTQVNPLNVENWVGLGQVYATVAPFNEGAATSIAPAYATAQALDPANPAILLYAGNAHRAAGDRGQSGADAEYAAALAAYEAAIRLKPDYASAYFAIIGMFDAAKKEADAVARADRLLSVTPNDAEIALQVGIIHYQKGRIGKARAAFEAAVRIIPDYANALYFLGVAYDREGNRSLALEQFERVLALNPDSVEVQAAIANVRAGKPALGNPDASKK